MSKKWKWISILSSVALTVALIGVWLFGTSTAASASEVTVEDVRTLTQSTTEPGLFGEGYLAHGGWGRGDKGTIDYQQLLADALGITVEKLQEAYQAAQTAALEQAVEQGKITQEQADRLADKKPGGRGFGDLIGHGFKGRGPQGLTDYEIDGNALLAEALGISTEELDAAREKANQAAFDQAIAEGIITQEQADQMAEKKQVREALASYLDPKALMAGVLGLSVQELETALAEGKTMRDLLDESGLDAAALREKMQAAHEAAIAQAVADGVITQEQADGMSMDAPGMRAWPGGGGRGMKLDRENMPDRENWPNEQGFRGRGGFGGRHPSNPDSGGADDGTGGTRFRRLGPNQESSAL